MLDSVLWKIDYFERNAYLVNMQETGTIISTDGKTAVIQINRGDKCGSCTVCRPLDGSTMRLEAINAIGASVGDVVNVSIEPKHVVKSSMIIFVLPLFMMFVGYYVAVRFFPPSREGVGIIGAFTALILSFVFIKMTDKRRNRDDINPAVIVDHAQKLSC